MVQDGLHAACSAAVCMRSLSHRTRSAHSRLLSEISSSSLATRLGYLFVPETLELRYSKIKEFTVIAELSLSLASTSAARSG